MNEAVLRAVLRFRPKDFAHWRVYAVVSAILDTGCRIEELLTARVSDFDLDNLLLTVCGKGRKERRVTFSIELRNHTGAATQSIRCSKMPLGTTE